MYFSKILLISSHSDSDKYSGPVYIINGTINSLNRLNAKNFEILNIRADNSSFNLKELSRKDMLRSFLCSFFLTKEEKIFLKYLRLYSSKFDFIIWFGSAYDPLTFNFRKYVDLKKLIFHVSDSILLFEKSRLNSKSLFKEIIAKKIEKKFLKSCFNKVIYVSKLDYELALTLTNSDNKKVVELLPIGVDIDYFKRVSNYNYNTKNVTLLFSGLLNYLPNIDSAIYIIKKIIPLLEINFEFRIVGKYPPKLLYELQKLDDRIVIVGEVDDIRNELEKADIFLCPMLSGSGIKIKILQAMAYGIPVITNKIGIEGFIVKPKCLVAFESASEISAFINNIDLEVIYRNSDESRKLIESDWSWIARTKLFLKIIGEY
jgi:glycosyltransferase involved in cell wall biosynthesis